MGLISRKLAQHHFPVGVWRVEALIIDFSAVLLRLFSEQLMYFFPEVSKVIIRRACAHLIEIVARPLVERGTHDQPGVVVTPVCNEQAREFDRDLWPVDIGVFRRELADKLFFVVHILKPYFASTGSARADIATKIMAKAEIPTAESWLKKAQEFYVAKNMIGALSSVRNALRLDVKNLAAWQLGSDIYMHEDKQYKAGRFAKALKRFAERAGAQQEISYAEKRLAEINEYYATQHRLWGETDLTHFASRGDLVKVRALLDSGVDANERNSTGWTALHRLGMRGSPEMARLLVEHGADLEATDSLNETPLITACRFENKPLVPTLVKLGANVNHVAKEKHTALWYAISSMKDLDTVRFLVESGADPNENYEYGDNPFLLSVSAQKTDVTNFLLPLTEDVARMNKHQVCAIRFAAGYNDTELIAKLLARGVDPEQATDYGHTPLMSAAENDAVDAAKLLLAHGADPQRKTQYGDSAISLAERRGNAEVYSLLTGGKELDRQRD